MIKNNVNHAIGQAIRLIRTARGLSQREVAEAIGISGQQLQKYERGVNRLSVEMMILVADKLRCSPVDILATSTDQVSQNATARFLSSSLTSAELRLLQQFRTITSADRQKTVVKITEWLCEPQP